MTLSRRKFLVQSVATGLAAGVQQMLSPRITIAQGTQPVVGAAGKYFIHVVLDGGGCGLSLMPPAQTAAFNALKARRPSLMRRDNNYVIDNPTLRDYLLSDVQIQGQAGAPYGLHPFFKQPLSSGLTNVHDRFVAGQGRIVAGAGKVSADGSHDSAMKKLLTGANSWDGGTASHWLGRLVDHYAMPTETVWLFGYQPGIPLTTSGPKPISLMQLSDYNFVDWGPNIGGASGSQEAADLARGLALDEDESQLTPAGRKFRRAVLSAFDAREEAVQRLNAPVRSEWAANQWLGVLFRDAVKIIRHSEDSADGRPYVIRIAFGGWDTHGSQRRSLDWFASFLNGNLSILAADLGAAWSRTAVLIESEFGRTIYESSIGSSGSVPPDQRGTEHGYANNHMVLSGGFRQATPLVVGEPASVAELTDAPYLSRRVDWRLPVAECLQWIGYDPLQVFPDLNMSTPLRLFL